MRRLILLNVTCMAAIVAGCASVSSPPQMAGTSPAAAVAAATPARAWAHETSDIPHDPAIRYGRLPNGMRYALRQNRTPPGRANVYLRIGAGSLHEREDQLGLAHFMEHMVFNGTRNVPEGEYVKSLERLGLAFGRDTNASTSFEETIYSLKLPDVRDEVVDTGLMLMREAAGEALLETAAIDRERGVVLSEERTRDGPGLRMARSQMNFFMKGQLAPNRFPIGTVEILKSAPRERFAEFYQQYYRPENATLVVVGDFDPGAMERKIVAGFSNWRAQGPAGPEPDLGPVAKRGLEVETYVEPGVPATITLAYNRPPDLRPDTRAKRREELVEQLGLAVLNHRMTRLILSADPPFTQAAAQRGTSLKTIDQTGFGAAFVPGRWQRALAALEQEQRRILQYGITRAELDRQITGYRESYRNGLAGAATRTTDALATNILTGLSQDKVVTTPEDRLETLEQTVASLTPEEVSNALRRIFKGDGPLIYVTSPEPISGGETAIAQAYQASTRLAVAPPPADNLKPWAYTEFGAPGRVVERREVADIGATFIRFANGARLTVRPSQVERNRIFVNVRAGDGLLDLPPGQPDIGWALREVLVEGGLGKLALEEIDDALVGKSYNVGAGITDSAFVLSGSTRPADFAIQMQVLAAYMTDPGWRTQGLERVKSTAAAAHRQYLATPQGIIGRDLPRLLRSGDPRFGVPPLAAMEATTMAQIKGALAPLRNEPIEVVITGDTTVDEAIRQTAATFGALPPRTERGYPPAAARTPFPAPTPTPIVLTHEGRGDQAMAYVAWPTRDEPSDLQEARTLNVLSAILRLRLTDELREGQAVTYSPSVGANLSWAFPGYGYLAATIIAEPGRMTSFFADTLKIARSLGEAPATEDEMTRALDPIIQGLENERQFNGYWSGALARAQVDPRRIEAARGAITGLRRVTPADIQRVAKKYLSDERAYRIVVLPRAKATTAQK